MPATRSRMSASSSMIRISDAMCLLPVMCLLPDRGLGFVDDGFRRFGGEPQPHPGAALARDLFRRVAQLDASAVLLENLAHDGEAEAGALLAGGDVGFEQAAAVFL